MEKITAERFGKFCQDYYIGLYPNLRLGQAFINEFFDSSLTDQELFYVENANEALNIIVSRYVINTEEDRIRLSNLRSELEDANLILIDAQEDVDRVEKMIAKIEDASVNSSGVCEYNVGCGWSDAICGNPLPCKAHDDLICSVDGCNRKATGGCDNAGSLVCGAPVCSSHHQCGRHGW